MERLDSWNVGMVLAVSQQYPEYMPTVYSSDSPACLHNYGAETEPDHAITIFFISGQFPISKSLSCFSNV